MSRTMKNIEKMYKKWSQELKFKILTSLILYTGRISLICQEEIVELK